jgi:hypothetical protein
MDPLRLVRLLAGVVMVWVALIVIIAFVMFFHGVFVVYGYGG